MIRSTRRPEPGRAHFTPHRRTRFAGATLVAATLLALIAGLSGCASPGTPPATAPTHTRSADQTSQPTPSASTTGSTPSVTPSTSATTTPTAPPTPRVNCAKVKCVALTFDDGPVPETTELLAVLRAKKVKATFFVLGSQVVREPAVIRQIVADGHVVGNHSWDHPLLTRLSLAKVRTQLVRTNRAIVAAGAPAPVVFRPPYGGTNRSILRIAGAQGMTQVLWDVDPMDWRDRNSALVASRVVAATRNGSIVLSHDIHPTTRAAYARIIDRLRARGFQFVTVPELLGSRLRPGASFRSAHR